MAEKVNITSPVGRIVAGSLYKPNTTDFDGKPLVVKTGPNAGQARVSYYIGLAIPKEPGHTHWAHTEWGKKIWTVGHAAFPAAAQRPDFAWKIEDGDSQIPNKRNKKPCDNEGWKGHWILRLSSGFAPKVYRAEGGGFVQEMATDYVKAGYYAEAAFSVDGNDNQNNSGVYLNTQMVCFRAYGPEISFGMDVAEAGFGASALPAGASLTPPPSGIPMPSAAPTGAASVPNGIGVPSAALPGVTAPVAVLPNPQFAQIPNASVPAAVVPAAPLPSAPVAPSNVRQMTAKAAGASYEAFTAAGWTDANLIAQGYMTA